MYYQLPNGKVIELSTEQYFEMSDDELEYMIVYNFGDIVENPWYGSVLTKHVKPDIEDLEVFPDLTDIPEIEKLSDLDAEIDE